MNTRIAIFSICSNNYLRQAGVLFESARRFHPGADLFLGLADAPRAPRYPDGVTILPAEDLGIADFRSMAFRYDIMEFNTAIKPFVFLALFERGYDRVLYFDPDIMLFRPLDDVLGALERDASFVLTPHLCSPPGPDAPRTEIDIMRTGIYNLGFLGCSRRDETEPILRWWARKLLHDCVNDQTGGYFVDQKFMDLVPGFADDALVSRDTTLNVAYWNLAQRRLDEGPDGWTVDGRPLGFFHFSGFDPTAPGILSRHTPEAPVPAALQSLLNHYAAAVLAAEPSPSLPYGFGAFDSGAPVPDAARRLFRTRHLTWSGDPFATYEAYLDLPDAHAVRGSAGETVDTLMGFVHSSAGDLRARFDLRKPGDVAAFVRWFEQHRADLGIARRGHPVATDPRFGRERDRAEAASSASRPAAP